ncbi:2'-5' RNA ligase family protein [Agilicoccus flavus]|uniref:2'-5' RNA ligase family protein n=1 Tax=Agilicoccus flavus TaxID=2775968 RepID=UPI001CF60A32|nr:2'-5' RNA ligase family protein [Agilicoccus flavus]
MRVFAAILPPPEALEDLREFLEPRLDAPGAPRWAADDQAHVTLAFAADAAQHRLDAADETLREVCDAVRAPRLSIAGGGAFPDVTRARVLWAGVREDAHAASGIGEPVDPAGPSGPPPAGDPTVQVARPVAGPADAAPTLVTLATRVRHALAGHGIAVAGGDLTPHVTLGRWRAPVEATRWLRILDTYAGPSWSAPEVALVASHLGAGRGGHPRHDTLATYALDDGRGGRWWARDPEPESRPRRVGEDA